MNFGMAMHQKTKMKKLVTIVESLAVENSATRNVEKHTIKTTTMTESDLKAIYEQMKAIFARDKELTHIDISFHIQKVKSEPKRAKINIKTFKDEIRTN